MWINKHQYSPSKRHYYPDAVILSDSEHMPCKDTDMYCRIKRREWVESPKTALCGMPAPSSVGNVYMRRSDGVIPAPRYGGLSCKENVNLNQKNLCAYCVRKYVERDPALKAAFDLLKGK